MTGFSVIMLLRTTHRERGASVCMRAQLPSMRVLVSDTQAVRGGVPDVARFVRAY